MVGCDDPAHDDPGRQAPARCAVAARPTGPAIHLRSAGRPRTVSDRACMAAIVFMARTSTAWALLPVREFGCGSVTTGWRRLPSGPRRGASGCRRCCWTNSATLAAGLVADQRGLLQPARRLGDHVGTIRSAGPSPGPSDADPHTAT